MYKIIYIYIFNNSDDWKGLETMMLSGFWYPVVKLLSKVFWGNKI